MLFDFNNNDFDFILGEAGTEVLINGTPSRALITNNPLSESKDTKKITTLNNVERGFLVDYDGYKWLVVSGDKRYSKYKGIMQRCNNFIIVNVSGALYHVPCIVTDRVSLNVDTNTYFATLDTEIYILVANDAINSNIKVNDIYKIGIRNYEVQNIDDISKSGLLVMKMKFTASEQVLPNYSITITNTEPLTTNVDAPVQLTIEQKDGTTILTEPMPVVFVSSDESIAIVSETGYVTPVSVGSVIISVSLESDASVSDSIEIIIEEPPVLDNFTISITGADSIKVGQSSTYSCIVMNNGVEVTGIECTWSLDSTSYASITSQSSTSCTVKAGSTSNQYVTLRVVKNDDESLFAEKVIKIASLF